MSKKNFINSPAQRFITSPKQPEQTEDFTTNIEDEDKEKKLSGTKTRRVQLIMQPELYEKAKAAAEKKGLSFNEYVHRVLWKSLENGEKQP